MSSIQIPRVFAPVLDLEYRFFVFYGGRGAAKSHSLARALLVLAMQEKTRIACCREIMTSINDSVHRLLSDLIDEYGLHHFFTVQKNEISGRNGSLFIFKGLKHNVTGIKSLEGVDVCLVEEAENVSDASWEVLIPTIRRPESSIIVSFNTRFTTDPTYRRFVAHTRDDAYVRKVLYYDNPFFPDVLEKERLELQRQDEDAYRHVWLGEPDTRKTGYIFARSLDKAREEGRITTVPYDASYPVYTGWDLGFGDSTAVWFFQLVGRELRWIDYYSSHGEELPHYIELLQSKPYRYADTSVYLPHDGSHGNIRGASPSKQLLKAGFKNVVLPRAASVPADIEQVREVFRYSMWDANRCADGLHCLDHYRYEYDEKKQVFRNYPLHDWASDAADAARTVAGAVSQLVHLPPRRVREQERQKQYDPYRNPYPRGGGANRGSWMGA